MLPVLVVLAAYFLGSVPFGVLIARARGIDLRAVGSGNIGATNAARAMGKGWGAVVLVLDAAKATVPILLCGALLRGRVDRDGLDWLKVEVATAAFLGHLFPVFLRFHGGKGVATAFGSFVGLQPLAAVLGFVTYALAYGLTRISSVGSLAAVLLFPLWLYFLRAPLPQWCFAGLVLALILLKHTGNIRRLLRRQEHPVFHD